MLLGIGEKLLRGRPEICRDKPDVPLEVVEISKAGVSRSRLCRVCRAGLGEHILRLTDLAIFREGEREEVRGKQALRRVPVEGSKLPESGLRFASHDEVHHRQRGPRGVLVGDGGLGGPLQLFASAGGISPKAEHTQNESLRPGKHRNARTDEPQRKQRIGNIRVLLLQICEPGPSRARLPCCRQILASSSRDQRLQKPHLSRHQAYPASSIGTHRRNVSVIQRVVQRLRRRVERLKYGAILRHESFDHQKPEATVLRRESPIRTLR